MKITSLTLALGLFAIGCGGAPPPAAEAPHGMPGHHGAPAAADANAPLKGPGEAAVGDRSKCPVSGEEFTVQADSPKVEHEGKTYYFCCPPCADKFKADPAKFLAKPAT